MTRAVICIQSILHGGNYSPRKVPVPQKFEKNKSSAAANQKEIVPGVNVFKQTYLVQICALANAQNNTKRNQLIT